MAEASQPTPTAAVIGSTIGYLTPAAVIGWAALSTSGVLSFLLWTLLALQVIGLAVKAARA